MTRTPVRGPSGDSIELRYPESAAGCETTAAEILYWHRCGFALWHMVIESDEKFHWSRLLEEEVITMTTEQLNWLLDGYDVWRQPHKMRCFLPTS